jgi:hypothetical protein
VLPAARRLYANQWMPAFPGGDDDRIDVRPRQQLAEIGNRGAFRIAILLIDRALRAFESLQTDIGDSEDPGVRHLEEAANVAAAHPPDADVPNRDAIARRSRLRSGDDVPGHDHRRHDRGGGGAQEIATVYRQTRSRRQLRHLSSQSDASVQRHCLTPGGAGQYKSCAPGLRNTQTEVQKKICAPTDRDQRCGGERGLSWQVQ